jgi:LemA protein
MKVWHFVTLGLALALIVSLSWGGSTYNNLVAVDQTVEQKWGDLQAAYQRRADLVPNIVSTVKAETAFEKDVLEKVTQARASATQIKLDAGDLAAHPEKVAEFSRVQRELSASLGRLLVVSEQYPTLKANAAFQDLRTTLEGTENRITFARRDFNKAVADYNIAIKSFPASLVAGSFKPRSPFSADPGADKAPTVLLTPKDI